MQCPVTGKTSMGDMNRGTLISNKLNLDILRQNSNLSDPMSPNFNYPQAFNNLNYKALKQDLYALMTNSKDWWPADYGTYGPFIIRMAWHSAGTYRVGDGRGGGSRGDQRFPPLSSWPDNANLDKARRLLWPIKQKYGNNISWADLFILAGNCALESMGLKTIGFAGGREDVWETQKDIYWGSESKFLDDERHNEDNDLENPLAAVQMGLIYVNPEGPSGKPDPLLSAQDVRTTFGRMGMNDEETVALIAGGHTFGKCHGAAEATYLGPAPDEAPIQEQGLGWKNSFGVGNAQDTITSGIEGAWKPHPQRWDMGYFTVLYKYDWELIKSPAGAYQWRAINVEQSDMIEDAHIKGVFHAPMMTTADLGLKFDPIYLEIGKMYLNSPDKFKDAFARAWFKLTHRDMGPISRYLGPEVPNETFIWQDPIPKRNYALIGMSDVAVLKNLIMSSSISNENLVKAAWASASTFRGSDRRGGANVARLRLYPQIEWEVNEPDILRDTLSKLSSIQSRFNSSYNKKKVSLADVIVLGGGVAIERAAKAAGYSVVVPFTPGRNDTNQEQTDVKSFDYLKPAADGFRNYIERDCSLIPAKMLIDRAQLLTLTIPEMTVLIGGLRVLNTNYKQKQEGVFTKRKGMLTNDFFVNLLDMNTVWQPINKDLYEGIDRISKEVKWTATSVDLIFGSDAELRAVCEVYACEGNEKKFISDFIKAWNKVMNADRFDVR